MSTGHRVRFSSASPALHTYSSSEDNDDDYPDPGPSRRPLHRQSLPPGFITKAPFPPPPRRRLSDVSSPPQLAAPLPKTLNGNGNAHAKPQNETIGNGVAHSLVKLSPSVSPQSVASEQLEHVSFSALEKSLPKAPPSQRLPSTGFFKSNNPFRRRHTSQPLPSTMPAIIAPSFSTPQLPPPPPRASQPRTRPAPPPPPSTSGGSAVVIASGKNKAVPPLPPRRASVSGSSAPSIAPLPTFPPKVPKKPRTSASSTSSVTSFSGSVQNGPTSVINPSSIIKKSLLAAEQAREAKYEKHGDGSIQVLRKWEAPPKAETLLASVNGKSRSASHTWSPGTLPKGKSKGKNAEIMHSVHSALRDAAMDDPPDPPKRKIKKKDDFDTVAKRYMAQEPGIKLWSCTDLLTGRAQGTRYALIILNQPITRKDVFLRAWAASQVRICADGGANRLYDLWTASQRARYLPDMIKGDLDSLRSDVNSFYASKGVSIKHDSDQYSTDLMKCIVEVENMEKATDRKYSLVFFGGLSGRVDQTVHTMSILHKLRTTRPNTFVVSSESLAWTLDSGSHLVEIDHNTMGQTCGILPVGVDKSHVITKGLKWDIDWVTSLGTSVSTSNHLLPTEPAVYLKTSKPVLWCIEIKPHLDRLTG